jgi:hypothetical protein
MGDVGLLLLAVVLSNAPSQFWDLCLSDATDTGFLRQVPLGVTLALGSRWGCADDEDKVSEARPISGDRVLGVCDMLVLRELPLDAVIGAVPVTAATAALLNVPAGCCC